MKQLTVSMIIALALAGSAVAQGAPTPISVGETVAGELATTDLQNPDSSYYDLYRFRGEAGQKLIITLTSSLFDGRLILTKGGTTTALAQDEDSGGGTNPKITYTVAEPGDLDLRAIAPDGGWGAYVLKLETAAR